MKGFTHITPSMNQLQTNYFETSGTPSKGRSGSLGAWTGLESFAQFGFGVNLNHCGKLEISHHLELCHSGCMPKLCQLYCIVWTCLLYAIIFPIDAIVWNLSGVHDVINNTAIMTSLTVTVYEYKMRRAISKRKASKYFCTYGSQWFIKYLMSCFLLTKNDFRVRNILLYEF